MELTITLENPEKRVQLFGSSDGNLRLIRELCEVAIVARDERVTIKGEQESVARAASLLNAMQRKLKRSDQIEKDDILSMLKHLGHGHGPRGEQEQLQVYLPGRTILAKTEGQEEYIQALEHNDMVFCTGPAGTGKTYLAVALAVAMLKGGSIRRIILARPAVEAGEKLGFLPGDMQAKVNPYLRPLFDALGDMMDYNQVRQFIQNDIIEVVPLAFMRGRTLNNAVVILDEAQNTTVSQMLMFLTRLGQDSKMIVTGDVSQTDLEKGRTSGLSDAIKRLRGIPGIAIIRLTEVDIVRHRLVQRIVKAYGQED